jgi:hypothetical protein
MVFKKIINTILDRDRKVIVPINCNVPEDDCEYIQIEIKDERLAE